MSEAPPSDQTPTPASVVDRLHSALREAALVALENDGYVTPQSAGMMNRLHVVLREAALDHEPQQTASAGATPDAADAQTPTLRRNGLTAHAIAQLPRVLQADDGVTCVVCHEPVATGQPCVRLPCDHSFHDPCITAWLRRNNSCPTCRRAAAPRDHELPDLVATPILSTTLAYSPSSSSFSTSISSSSSSQSSSANNSNAAESQPPPPQTQQPQTQQPQTQETQETQEPQAAGTQQRMRVGVTLAHTILAPLEATVLFHLWNGQEYETTFPIYATMAQLFDWLLRLTPCNNAPSGLQMRFLASGVMHMYKTSESAAWLQNRTLVRCGLASLYVIQVDPAW